MFRPNLKCEVATVVSTDIYGKRLYSDWTTVPFGVVKLEESSGKTSVRTDSSASRGSAQEITTDARLLFPAYVALKQGDRIRHGNFNLTVVSVAPRYNVLGRLDHWQVDCNVWAG